jgi:hypothetical protein
MHDIEHKVLLDEEYNGLFYATTLDEQPTPRFQSAWDVAVFIYDKLVEMRVNPSWWRDFYIGSDHY